MYLTLATLKPGLRAIICGFSECHGASNAFLLRMMEIGLTQGTEVEVAYNAPFGGTIAVRCRGALIALRLTDADTVQVHAL